MDPLRIGLVFVSVFLGLRLAGVLMGRLERALAPVSRGVGMPAGLLAVGVLEPRLAHGALSRLLREGEVTERHVVAYSLVSWPFRFAAMYLRLGIFPLALGALGMVGAAYLAMVFVPSLVGLAIGMAMVRGLSWPQLDAAPHERTLAALRQALGVTARYAAFEAVFYGLSLLGVSIPLGWLPLSPTAVAVLAAASARPSLGVMAAGPALANGLITPVETLAALLMGRLVYMTVYEFPRSTVQFYASYYPARTAMRILMYTAGIMYPTTVLLVVGLMFMGR